MTQPAGFLAYQWELREAVRQEKVVVVEKSRRTGYSWAAAEVAVEHAAKSKQDGGMDVFYMGYNLEMAREFIEYCGDWGKLFQLGAADIGRRSSRIQTIQSGTSRPSAWRPPPTRSWPALDAQGPTRHAGPGDHRRGGLP
jgi:hypothetical protein